jgi:hypothetical protein
MTSGAAVLCGGVLIVPPELLAELLAELQAPRRQVPMDVRIPQRTPQMAALVDAVMSGAIARNQALRESGRKRDSLAERPSAPSLGASVVAGLSDGGVVGVAVAAEMLDKSQQWIRVLASRGALPGARMSRSRCGNGGGSARMCWRIPLVAVHAYLQERAA